MKTSRCNFYFSQSSIRILKIKIRLKPEALLLNTEEYWIVVFVPRNERNDKGENETQNQYQFKNITDVNTKGSNRNPAAFCDYKQQLTWTTIFIFMWVLRSIE